MQHQPTERPRIWLRRPVLLLAGALFGALVIGGLPWRKPASSGAPTTAQSQNPAPAVKTTADQSATVSPSPVQAPVASATPAQSPASPQASAPASTAAKSAPPKAAEAASPAVAPTKPTFVRTVEGVHEYRLANGLQVLLMPDPASPKITANIIYHVGSRHEVYGETGMAHLLEHLVFKGTPRHPNIGQELKDRGAAFNGTTWLDRTNYFETVAATPENLEWALDLEADRMVNSYIARKDLDTEMTVVRNEFEIGETRPSRVLAQAVSATMFHWHNYGKSTIGSRSDLENVSIERLQAFYRNYYQPDNATLVLAGNIDREVALDLIVRKFGPIPKPSRTLERHYTVEPTQTGERSVIVRRTGEAPIVQISHRIVSALHPDAAPLQVLSSLLGTAPTGRLHQRLVATGKATAIWSDWFMGYDPGGMTVGAELRRQDNPDEVRDLLLSVLSGLTTEPVTQAEVDRAKAAFAARFETQRVDTQASAIAMTNAVASGDWRLLFWNRDQIAKVTKEDVQRVALHYLKRDNRTVGMFLPTDAPERAVIAPRVDPAVALKDFTGGMTISEGEAFDPSPANIDTRTTTVKLPSGLQLAMLPKRTRGDRVHGQITLRFGSEETLKGKGAAPGMVGELLTKGTQRLNRGALQDELTRLKATLGISGGATSATAAFSTTKDNLPAVLALIVECLKTPAFPADEFDQLKRAHARQLEAAQRAPGTLAGQRLAELFNSYAKDDPRYAPTLAEQRERLEALTLDDVKRFHAEFYGANNGQASLIGSFEVDAIKSQVTALFSNWDAPQAYARLSAKRATPAARNEVIVVPDQANGTFNARLNFAMRDNDPEYPALVVANTIFGGGALSSRLGDRLRQKEGISYGSGSSIAVNTRNDAASFSISASYAPTAADKLQTAVCEELRRALADGFTDDEVSRARESILSNRRIGRTNDQTLVSALVANLYNERTMAWSAELDTKLKAVTAAQASAAFKRAVDPAKLVAIKAGTLPANDAATTEKAPCGP